jgi:ABC-type transporter Mla maintaining outer membrane lipid asymmetry ATPase subunit MlaF
MSDRPNIPVIELQASAISALREVARPVVKNVTWTVAPGEFWVIAGQQHVGKVDLLLTVAGLLPPLAGTCRLFGRDTREFGGADPAERLQVGLVFAGGQLFHQLTLAENIALPVRYHRNLTAPEAERAIGVWLDLLELTPLAHALPADVSLDWLKRAALARALVLQPQVLLCDHPLGGLGTRHRQWWLGFLDQLGRGHEVLGGRPLTIIVTTEDLPPWKAAGRRFALLRDEQFFTYASWAELAASPDPMLHELLTDPPDIEL